MTQYEAKEKLLLACKKYKGTRETGDNNNPFAEIVGHELYGWYAQNQPWCDIYVDAIFIECFGYDRACELTYQYSGCTGAACAYSAAYYQNHGAWYSEPQLLDQVFFYSGNGINHTGLVIGINGNTITTSEGNSSDMVAERSYFIHDATIAGYGRPKWEVFDRDDTEDAAQDVSELDTHTVQRGDTMWSIAVKYLGSGTRWKELAAWNGMTEKEAGQLKPGQIIRLYEETTEPDTETTPDMEPEEEQRTWTVQKGDTLWGIAEKVYGTGMMYISIMRENGLAAVDIKRIQPGMILKLPKKE